jgi:hypothetical protein
VLAAGASAGSAHAAIAATSGPAKTIHAQKLAVRPETLPVGTRLPGSRIGISTYIGASFGVALGAGSQAQYPVQTGNGGRTWRTDGPALHIDAANAPFSVSTVSAATKKLQYAYGSGQVVDVTSGGGPTWRSALFDGVVMAVVPAAGRKNTLIAFVDEATGSNQAKATTYQYVTRDGGRTWHLSTALGG